MIKINFLDVRAIPNNITECLVTIHDNNDDSVVIPLEALVTAVTEYFEKTDPENLHNHATYTHH